MVSLPDHLAAAPVGKEKLPRAVVAQHQRRRLLTAAVGVFSERGYAATTVEHLTAAAEIGVGSFYSLCSGKEDCLLALYDDAVSEARSAIASAVGERAESSWPEQTCVGLRVLLDWVAEQPLQARIVFIEIQTAGGEALRRYTATLDSAAEFLALGRKIAQPSSRRLPESLEQTTVSGIAWLLHRYLSLGKAASAPELFEDLAELVLEPYLGEDQAREAVSQVLLAPPR
ncbi:MAG TPA: TetR/AcrR family transcriptional regulator [Solirubrobacterales bacterium]|nr:TetR/AcrR family transcriptional regulator [Solirubrobacterales bacterium]